MYFEDGTPHTYSAGRPNGINIGWLELGKPFPTAKPNPILVKILRGVKLVDLYRGFHNCEFCGPATRISLSDGLLILPIPVSEHRGNGTIIVPQKGTKNVYCAPALLPHYIEDHWYAPPEDFVASVMAMGLDKVGVVG
jgi:hypothetical protein